MEFNVQSYSFVDEKCIVAFKSSNKKYTYNKDKVQIIKSALQSKKAATAFNYLKTIADAVGLKSEDGKNILAITATDNLNGFSAIIRSVFPESSKQVCVVHQIRNACRYVLWKDKKAFTADMQPIYDAPNKQAAQATLADFADRWESKYPYAVRSWKENLDELTVFYDFPLEIRRIIYTTNITENMNGKIRKYTKNKLSFLSDDAVLKSVCIFSFERNLLKMDKPIRNWAIILNQFSTLFENRVQL